MEKISPRERERHIYLSFEQRQQLKEIVVRDTPARSKRARALLLIDEGFYGPGRSLAEVAERVSLHITSVGDLVGRAIERGANSAAIGISNEKNLPPKSERGGKGSKPKLSAGQAREIAEAYAIGEFTQKELARRYGVSPQTIGRAIKRENAELTEQIIQQRQQNTLEQDQEIAEAYASGEFTQKELARRYGITQASIWKAIKREEERQR